MESFSQIVFRNKQKLWRKVYLATYKKELSNNTSFANDKATKAANAAASSYADFS